jgi:4-amino-4-deoxy-L-arabinose transferase-like glycosyltransferase
MKPTSSSTVVTPALVTQKAVRRLPRWALWALCAAYVLPGLFGRDPWKTQDIASFGHMWSLAQGHASWWQPSVGGVVADSGGILPYWLGGAFISVLSGWVDPALAARLPFAALLAAILALVWYTTYELALTDAAQPLPLAFGGEAQPKDYARAMADGGLLALIASLGLLQLGHETTPELLQLTGSSLFLFGLAAVQRHPHIARLSTLLSLPIMALSGSPSVAMLLATVGAIVCLRSAQDDMRIHLRWVLGAAVLALALASALSQAGLPGWAWRLHWPERPQDLFKSLTWFTWPTLPLAALTLWHWRRQIWRRHIAVPMLAAAVGIVAAVAMGGSERALLAALPPLAVLAAFALPILQRSLGAALDWFSVFFFTVLAGLLWLGYVAMHLGVPANLSIKIAKTVPNYQLHFSWLTLGLALIASLTWLALVRWRTARQAHALWKSLVLPAGGVALCWLLFMTLWLPPVDQARSYRILLSRLHQHIPRGDLVCAPNAPVGLLTALEYFDGYRVDGRALSASDAQRRCDSLLLRLPARQVAPAVPGWVHVAQYNQRSRNSEQVAVYRRVGP